MTEELVRSKQKLKSSLACKRERTERSGVVKNDSSSFSAPDKIKNKVVSGYDIQCLRLHKLNTAFPHVNFVPTSSGVWI